MILVLIHNIFNCIAFPFADPLGKGMRAARCGVYHGYISCDYDWCKAYLFFAVRNCPEYGSDWHCMCNVFGLVQSCHVFLVWLQPTLRYVIILIQIDKNMK